MAGEHPLGHQNREKSNFLGLLATLVVVGSFALGGTLTFAAIYLQKLAQSTVVDVAAAAGMRLTPGELTFGFGFVQLFDSHVTLRDVPGVTVRVRRVDVDFSRLTPTSVLVSGVQITAKGEPYQLYEQTRGYLNRLQRVRFDGVTGQGTPKFEVRQVDFKLESSHPFIPNIQLDDLRVAPLDWTKSVEITVKTARTRLGDQEFFPLSLVFLSQGEELSVGWGNSLQSSLGTLSYRSTEFGQTLAASFKPIRVGELAQAVGQPVVPKELAQSNAEGQLLVHLDSATAKINGTFEGSLSNFVPPHPAELTGYKFAPLTHLTLTFSSSPLYTSIELPIIKLTNGDLEMRGNGRLERQDFHLRLLAELTAILDCVTLAKGFAAEEIGGGLGNWGARNAAQTLRGSVRVQAQIDADSSHLADAKVKKRIGVGCGLRPIALVDWLTLGLPPIPDAKTVDKLLKRLPKNTSLTEVTRVLPTLDEVIDVNLKAARRNPVLGMPPLVPKRL